MTVQDIFDAIFSAVDQVLGIIFVFLPDSPFTSFIDSLDNLEYLGWFNWFIPVGEIMAVATAWGFAIGVFYMWQIILRWIKATAD